MKNISILAFSPTHSSSGKSFALGAMLKQLQKAKESDTVVITDCRGDMLRSFRSRNISIHTVVQSEEQLISMYASNNWLKMHGYPLRRKMHNAHRRRDRKQNKHKPRHPVVIKVGPNGTAYQVDTQPISTY